MRKHEMDLGNISVTKRKKSHISNLENDESRNRRWQRIRQMRGKKRRSPPSPSFRQGKCVRVIDHKEVLPAPVRLLRTHARREARGALLADGANTLRELVDLIIIKRKKKRERP